MTCDVHRSQLRNAHTVLTVTVRPLLHSITNITLHTLITLIVVVGELEQLLVVVLEELEEVRVSGSQL